MLIDVTKKLKNFDGDDMFLNTDGPAAPQLMTLRNTSVTLLSAGFRDTTISGEDALVRFQLAGRIHEQDKLDLDVDEISLILQLAAKSFNPLVYGRMVELLDPAKLKK